ncbi:uncharacterized protein Z518_07802 [Rhinocladiella mackenziei CBS 650.93]|uniref:tRNA (guanine(10)-N(2))-methyltransferase n=1 Tax=Rhinocladiella mackenziei CBS 650.93 TaxID=1442369 RepID=A0A0D2H1B6_9EURO|nr:uncharacterized protein Z518_07802 [Rhinocladiella mackenziei CBS 650.93]KIX04248.1 hypothetical protein Z518_07802 [Rhinocladiella mackenziei CBS 650.93]
MEYLIRFVQVHESFRRPELEALSKLAGVHCEVVSCIEDSPFCVVRFHDLQHARKDDVGSGDDIDVDERVRGFESRAILSKCVYEIWGIGCNYDELHGDVSTRSRHLWAHYKHLSFKFSVDCYGSTRDVAQQKKIIDSFCYLGFEGKIRMKNPDVEFAVLEEWVTPCLQINGDNANEWNGAPYDPVARTSLRRIMLVRKIGDSRRWLREKHDLKKRPYISTTSMDAELALLTANLALACPGKIFLDPFVGTGGFMVAAAELGAVVLGSDIDGRSYRGKGGGVEKGVGANFKKYGLSHLFGDCLTSDLVNTPFRASPPTQQSSDGRWLDGIVCDPPYGVREGLKVLGTRKAASTESNSVATESPTGPPIHCIDGVPAYTLPGYIAPKKPYSFARMLYDILAFAARTLVDGGRLAFWMPSANENDVAEEVTVIPMHPNLELKHECIQKFNKWSRRLLVYERRPGMLVPKIDMDGVDCAGGQVDGTADELNPFRKRYFQPIADRMGS